MVERELVRRANARQQALWNGSQGWFWAREQPRYDRMLAPLQARLIDVAAVRPGERVGDIGCGSGSTTLALATTVGPSGRVLGLDISAPLLALAGQRLAAAGLAQAAELVCADAATREVAPASFDVIVSRFGMSYFGDLPAAWGHIASWLRPGGRLGYLCWQAEQANEWMSLPRAAVQAHLGPQAVLPEPPAPGPAALAPGPCALAAPEDNRRLLAGAGLDTIAIEPITGVVPVGRDVADVMRFVRAGGLDAVLARLPAAAATASLRTLHGLLAARETPQGVLLGVAAWLVTARAGMG